MLLESKENKLVSSTTEVLHAKRIPPSLKLGHENALFNLYGINVSRPLTPFCSHQFNVKIFVLAALLYSIFFLDFILP